MRRSPSTETTRPSATRCRTRVPSATSTRAARHCSQASASVGAEAARPRGACVSGTRMAASSPATHARRRERLSLRRERACVAVRALPAAEPVLHEVAAVAAGGLPALDPDARHGRNVPGRRGRCAPRRARGTARRGSSAASSRASATTGSARKTASIARRSSPSPRRCERVSSAPGSPAARRGKGGAPQVLAQCRCSCRLALAASAATGSPFGLAAAPRRSSRAGAAARRPCAPWMASVADKSQRLVSAVGARIRA